MTLAVGSSPIYAFDLHNMPSTARRHRKTSGRARPYLSATHVVRPARDADVDDILALIAPHAATGAMLPRSNEQVVADLPAYVVVCDDTDHVRGCAALYEYSPSLAEVGSVAVSAGSRREGLGSLAVRGVEGLARQRGIDELFALSSSEGFFESLGYERTSVARYPEKLARHEALRALGVTIVPRTCYRRRPSTA